MSPREERPRDPQRPERIVAAARGIAREHGVGAVTHRTVADRAGVPLGSTTYYFASIDDLLGQAIRLDITEFQQRLTAALKPRDDRGDSVGRLIAFLCDEAEQAETLAGEYELYLTAFTRATLKPLALEWGDIIIHAYSRYVPETAATAITMLFDGYAIRTALAGTNQFPARAELTRQLTALAARS